MKTVHFAIAASMVSALALGISGLTMTAGSVYHATDQIKIVNTVSERS